MTRVFKCLECGHCCERIIINDSKHGIRLGMSLEPDEVSLFDDFSGAVVPCMGLMRSGRSRVKVVSYQMVMEPCPLYDSVTRRCTVYKRRPLACKAYPFDFMVSSGGHSVETSCSWAKEQKDVVYGKTVINAGTTQNFAGAMIVRSYAHMAMRADRNGYTRLMMYDLASMDWVEVSSKE